MAHGLILNIGVIDMGIFVKTALAVCVLSAVANTTQAHEWPLGVVDQDVDGNKLWDYVEKTKQPMMRELGYDDQYTNAMSDRLQFMMQEQILHIDKPDIQARIIKAQVREMACLTVLANDKAMIDVVSILEVAFSKHELKSEGFQILSDDMVKAAFIRPDATNGTCGWYVWPRNDHSHPVPPRKKYTGKIVHDRN